MAHTTGFKRLIRPDVADGSISALRRRLLNIRVALDSGHKADMPARPTRAVSGSRTAVSDRDVRRRAALRARIVDSAD